MEKTHVKLRDFWYHGLISVSYKNTCNCVLLLQQISKQVFAEFSHQASHLKIEQSQQNFEEPGEI